MNYAKFKKYQYKLAKLDGFHNLYYGKRLLPQKAGDTNNNSQIISEERINENNTNAIMADAINKFAINTYENLDGASNLFSPLSLSFLLSLIQLGALGTTDQQLTKILGKKSSVDDLKNIYNLFNDLTTKLENIFLVNDEYLVNQDFLNMTNEMLLIVSDDYNNLENIVRHVNDYVKKNTNGMITNIISASDITNDAAAILINCIYFRATWLYKFDVSFTQQMLFHKTNMIDMMHQINYFNYFENKQLQVIEMQYAKTAYVMGVVLPKKYLEEESMNFSTNDIPILTYSQIAEIINNLQYTRISLFLPKFTQRKRLELSSVFKKMGLDYLFSEKANLSVIFEPDNLYVSQIIHEAVVIVDEMGTEASATTAITMEIRANREEPEPKIFKADHAFLYYIRHVASGIFLFFGDYQGD